LLQAFYNLSRELLLEFIREAIRLPHVKQDAGRLHRAQVEAIARHDIEGARMAAREHMLYLKEKEITSSNS
jgi:DNA-binding FadR family transcriptional regulator